MEIRLPVDKIKSLVQMLNEWRGKKACQSRSFCPFELSCAVRFRVVVSICKSVEWQNYDVSQVERSGAGRAGV